MAIEITMPKLSDTMEEGTILKWRVREGDKVSQGDIIAEVETDKAAMEMEAFDDGVVESLKVGEGETVPVGTVIALLSTSEEEETPPVEKKKEEKKAVEKEAKPEEEEKEKEEKEEEEEEEEKEEEEEPKQKEKSKPSEEMPEKRPEPEREAPERRYGRQISASPAARNLAREKGMDLSRVRGTGPGGRIVLLDVERAREKSEDMPEKTPAGRKAGPQTQKSVKIRRIVARKMVESWQNVPHFFVTVAADMTDVIRSRKSLRLSINDFILAAVARSLRDHPWVNSTWKDGEAVEQKSINIALAVATDRGLYNPVIKECEKLNIREISRRSRELGEKAHKGDLSPDSMEGGTFTVSNMGMLDVESFSAIITPPQAAVLAVGTVKGEVVVDEKGEPAVAPILRLTLSADHRVLDGADAAEFLATVKSYLEAPLTLVAWE